MKRCCFRVVHEIHLKKEKIIFWRERTPRGVWSLWDHVNINIQREWVMPSIYLSFDPRYSTPLIILRCSMRSTLSCKLCDRMNIVHVSKLQIVMSFLPVYLRSVISKAMGLMLPWDVIQIILSIVCIVIWREMKCTSKSFFVVSVSSYWHI